MCLDTKAPLKDRCTAASLLNTTVETEEQLVKNQLLLAQLIRRYDKVCFWSKEDNIWSDGVVDEDYTHTNIMLYGTVTGAAKKNVNPMKSITERSLFIYPFDRECRSAPSERVAVNGESHDLL